MSTAILLGVSLAALAVFSVRFPEAIFSLVAGGFAILGIALALDGHWLMASMFGSGVAAALVGAVMSSQDKRAGRWN